jgi:dCMP deaminase
VIGRENGRRPNLATYALALAGVAAIRSEDPHRKVGTALLRKDGTIAGLGYNGAPPGVDLTTWQDRDARRDWVIHAEVNALRYVTPGEVWLLASTSLPCSVCMLQIAAYGVAHVIYRDELDPAIYDRELILRIAEAADVAVRKGDTA